MATIGARIHSTLVFVAVIGLFLGLSGYEILRNLREVLFFERTTGTVTAYVVPDKNAEEDLEAGRLEFTYVVDGTQYEGRYPPEYWMSMPRAPYPLLERGWDIREQVDVYYALSNPSDCTLSPRIEPFPFAVITFVLPFVVWGFLTVRSGGSAASWHSANGTAFVPTNAILSAVASFGIMIAGRYGGSRTGVALGLLLPTAIVPGCMWLLLRRGSGARQRARARRNREARNIGLRTIPPKAQSTRREPWSLSRESQLRDAPGRQGRRRIAPVPALVAVVWCGVTGAVLVPVILAFVESWQAQRQFVETKGLVLESRLKEEKGSDNIDYRPVVIYQYEIDGKVYRNDRIMFGTIRVSRSQDEAESLRRRFTQNGTLPVYYNPDDPQQAVLDIDVAQEYALPAFAMSAFAVAGVCMVVAIFFPSLEVHNERLKRVLTAAFPAYFCAHVFSFIALGLLSKIYPGNNVVRVWIGVGVIAAAVLGAAVRALFNYRAPESGPATRRSASEADAE